VTLVDLLDGEAVRVESVERVVDCVLRVSLLADHDYRV